MPKPNVCKNLIKVTFFEDNSGEFYIELFKKFKDAEWEDSDSFTFGSDWTSPIQFLQNLCNKYNVDIIGVAYEFDGGYVESFELKNQLIEEEIPVPVLHIVEVDDLEEEITELPKAQDDEFLDEECPADLDPEKLNLSDDEILKSFQ